MRIRPALGFLALLAACGGKPAGGKVPAANPAHVAGVAAAAAALVTLADPDAARQHQENRGGERESKGKKVNETVPEGVLFPTRATQESGQDKETETMPPCSKLAAAPTDQKPAQSIDLFPPIDSNKVEAPERCKDEKDEADTSKNDEADTDTSRNNRSKSDEAR